MSETLRILILEDRASDVELMKNALCEGGIEFESRRAASRQEFTDSLEAFAPDIVLADYNLPSFDGREAVRITRAGYPHIPIVVVSGTLGDETVIDLIRAGARDYVLKTNLSRLPHAVRRTLAEEKGIRSRKRAEQRLKLANTVVENSSTVLFRLRAEARWTVEYVSENIRQFGYEPEDFLSGALHKQDIYHPDDAVQVVREIEQRSARGEQSFTISHRIQTKSGATRWVENRTMPVRDHDGAVVGYQGIMQDITERVHADARIRELLSERTELLHEMIAVVALAVEKRDPCTAGHQQRVSMLATAIAADLGLDEATVEGVRVGGMIHDVGKISIPAEILTKPGGLTPVEWEIIHTHPVVGAEIVAGVHSPWPLAEIILQHHERLDGSGYPDGEGNGDIRLEARILSVADVVDAMVSHRPYRPALGVDAALAEIAAGRGTRYDAHAVDSCTALIREGRFALDTAPIA